MEFLKVIDGVSLNPNELQEETAELIDEMLRAVGKIRYNHPDITRVLEEYPRLLQKYTALLEEANKPPEW